MKKHLLLLALTLCTLAAKPQKEQICQVREQNSRRKPLDKVQVIFEDAPAAVSQSDGTVRRKPTTKVILPMIFQPLTFV